MPTPRRLLAVFAALAAGGILLNQVAFAEGGCPDIHGNPVIPAGRSITDDQTGRTFVCGADGAWLSAPASPTPTPPPDPTPSPASAAPRAARGFVGTHSTLLIALGTLVSVVMTVATVSLARRQRVVPVGRLQVHDGAVIRSVDLRRLPPTIRIGTQGEVALESPGVNRHHAAIQAQQRGRNRTVMALIPHEGATSIRRNGSLLPVLSPTPLSDGDEIGIGDARLRFRSIATRPASRWERRTA